MGKKRGRPRKNPEVTTETKETKKPVKKKETAFEKTVSKKRDKDGNVRATVMTKAASEIADEARKRPPSKYYNSDCIMKPKG